MLPSTLWLFNFFFQNLSYRNYLNLWVHTRVHLLTARAACTNNSEAQIQKYKIENMEQKWLCSAINSCLKSNLIWMVFKEIFTIFAGACYYPLIKSMHLPPQNVWVCFLCILFVHLNWIEIVILTWARPSYL